MFLLQDHLRPNTTRLCDTTRSPHSYSVYVSKMLVQDHRATGGTGRRGLSPLALRHPTQGAEHSGNGKTPVLIRVASAEGHRPSRGRWGWKETMEKYHSLEANSQQARARIWRAQNSCTLARSLPGLRTLDGACAQHAGPEFLNFIPCKGTHSLTPTAPRIHKPAPPAPPQAPAPMFTLKYIWHQPRFPLRGVGPGEAVAFTDPWPFATGGSFACTERKDVCRSARPHLPGHMQVPPRANTGTGALQGQSTARSSGPPHTPQVHTRDIR